MPAVRSRPLRVVAVLSVLLVAGACGAGAELRGAMSSDDPPPVAVPQASGEPGPTDDAAPAGPCTGEGLAVSLGPSTVVGDTVTQDLILQNTGAAPCVMRGFPSVVPVAGNEGDAVGEPAFPLGERGPAVRLAPRAAATAPLSVRAPSAYAADDCRPLPVRGLRVIPAGGTGRVFVPREGTACSAGPLDPPPATIGTTVGR